MPTTPDSLTALAKGHLADARKLLARVTAPPPGGARTEANTLIPYDELRVKLEAVSAPASLHANVHPDAAVREAAEAAERDVAAFATDLGLNRELYDALSAVPLDALAADTRRFLERTLADFRLSLIHI